VDESLLSDIVHLIKADSQRMKVLEAMASLQLPDCYVAAGFVRNLVWDYLHGFECTPLSDVDVIYFDPAQAFLVDDLQHRLSALLPHVNWQVKNQAIMHVRNGDEAYMNSTDAMMHWPEKETAIGVKLTENNSIEVAAPFGLTSLFDGCISYNNKRPLSVFEQRVQSKNWLTTWPKLKVVH